MKQFPSIMLICLLLLAGCFGQSPQKPDIPPEMSIQTEEAARSFFEALHEEDFQEAAELYGGSYEILIDMNPDLDPEDGPALLARGCQINGFVCLRMGQVLSVGEIRPGKYDLEVQFLTEGGEIFWLDSCCGANLTEMDPTSEFQIQIVLDDSGDHKVMDLPPYVP